MSKLHTYTGLDLIRGWFICATWSVGCVSVCRYRENDERDGAAILSGPEVPSFNGDVNYSPTYDRLVVSAKDRKRKVWGRDSLVITCEYHHVL